MQGMTLSQLRNERKRLMALSSSSPPPPGTTSLGQKMSMGGNFQSPGGPVLHPTGGHNSNRAAASPIAARRSGGDMGRSPSPVERGRLRDSRERARSRSLSPAGTRPPVDVRSGIMTTKGLASSPGRQQPQIRGFSWESSDEMYPRSDEDGHSPRGRSPKKSSPNPTFNPSRLFGFGQSRKAEDEPRPSKVSFHSEVWQHEARTARMKGGPGDQKVEDLLRLQQRFTQQLHQMHGQSGGAAGGQRSPAAQGPPLRASILKSSPTAAVSSRAKASARSPSSTSPESGRGGGGGSPKKNGGFLSGLFGGRSSSPAAEQGGGNKQDLQVQLQKLQAELARKQAGRGAGGGGGGAPARAGSPANAGGAAAAGGAGQGGGRKQPIVIGAQNMMEEKQTLSPRQRKDKVKTWLNQNKGGSGDTPQRLAEQGYSSDEDHPKLSPMQGASAPWRSPAGAGPQLRGQQSPRSRSPEVYAAAVAKGEKVEKMLMGVEMGLGEALSVYQGLWKAAAERGEPMSAKVEEEAVHLVAVIQQRVQKLQGAMASQARTMQVPVASLGRGQQPALGPSSMQRGLLGSMFSTSSENVLADKLR